MLAFFLMTLNGWAAWSCAKTISVRKNEGLKSPWFLHALGAANVFFCVINAITFFGS